MKRTDPAESGWEAYVGGPVLQGGFKIEDGRVTGTLPPGSTADKLQVSDPELRAEFDNATDLSGARVLPRELPELPAGAVVDAWTLAKPIGEAADDNSEDH